MQTGGFNLELLIYRQETSDTTPTVEGLAAYAAGTSIIATVDGVQYTATVQSDHTFSFTTGTLAAGWYDVQVMKAGTNEFVESGGDGFRMPDGTSHFYEAGDTSYLFEDVLYVKYDYWVFDDGAGTLTRHAWSL